MRSHLLEGVVRHRRARPFVYELQHDVYYVALDLDELDEVARVSAPCEPQRPKPVRASATTTISTRPPTTSGPAFLDHLRNEGIDPDGWRITLVTNLRVLGYVFNPASFYLVPRRRRDPPDRRRRGPQHPWRAASLHAPAAGRCRDRVRRCDGEGVLRLAVHRDARRVHRPRPRRAVTSPHHDQPGACRTGCSSTPAWTSPRDR